MQSWTAIIFSLISIFTNQQLFNEHSSIDNFVGVNTAQQAQKFINVDDTDFNARFEKAVQQGRKSTSKFWVAYSFDVRPGVMVDAELYNNGNVVITNGSTADLTRETRNLGVFLLHDAQEITRVEVYNLERQREYSGYPVYWLGRGNNQESLGKLRKIVGDTLPERINDQAVRAIAVHDDPSVSAILKSLVETSKNNRLRSNAIVWLGDFEGESPFLLQLARAEAEPIAIRRQAIFGLGRSKDSSALQDLKNLYATDISRDLKRQILFATSIHSQQEQALEFLIQCAESDNDLELKNQALFWLGQKAGSRSLRTLTNVVEKNEAETEVQKQAVFVLSQRPKDEAIPTLLKVAREHKNLAVRKQAMFWLGQSGDQRALDYFKEVLQK